MAGWWPWSRDPEKAGRILAGRRADAVLARLDTLSEELEGSVQELKRIAERLHGDGREDPR